MLKRIAVLVSGGGTNLAALIAAQNSGVIKSGRICAVISSNPDAYALTRAGGAGIDTYVVNKADYPDREDFSNAVDELISRLEIDLIVFAGFNYILSEAVVKKYPKRMINVHPALIPAFCGDGFYGLRVHQAALDHGVKITGATVHYVNEVTDGGEIILQKAVNVLDGDTPQTLQKRVMEQAEQIILPQAVELCCMLKHPTLEISK